MNNTTYLMAVSDYSNARNLDERKEALEEIYSLNKSSHLFGTVDDCIRCLFCEIGVWNGHKELCPDNPMH